MNSTQCGIAHKGIWLEQSCLRMVEYRAKSAEGKVRHPFFKGLRGRMKELAAEFRLSSTEPDRGKSSSASHYDQTVSTHPPAGQVCRQSHKRPLD